MSVPATRWVSTLFAVLVLAGFAWLVAPLLSLHGRAPLQPLPYRAAFVAALLGVWLLGGTARRFRARRHNTRLIRGLLRSVLDPGQDPSRAVAFGGLRTWSPTRAVRTLRQARREERASRRGQVSDYLEAKAGDIAARAAESASRFELEAAVLSLSRGIRRGFVATAYLAELPWYLAVGPAEAGAGTLLEHSRLRLFSRTAHSGRPLAGVGASRGCRWYFTSEAVFFQVRAGASGPTASDWLQIPDLLASTRGVPINGILAVYPVSALLDADAGRREALACLLRDRLQALQGRYKATVPVYLIFSQADRIGGFAEFLAELGGAERDQAWGARFPCPPGDSPAEALQGALGGLVRALRARLPARAANAEPSVERLRALAFPQQLAAVQEAATDVLKAIAEPDPDSDRAALPLRGVYLTSTRGGTETADPLLQRIATRLKLNLPPLPAASYVGKDRFCVGLFRSILPGDRHIAATDPGRERRRGWLRTLALSTAAALVMGTAGILGFAAWQGSIAMQRLQDRLDGFHQALVAGLAGASDVDLLPALDALRGITEHYPRRLPWYLAAERRAARNLGAEARAAYRRLLEKDFLPRILMRIENRLQDPALSPVQWRTNAELYLMLGDLMDLNSDRLRRELQTRWKVELPDRPRARDDLAVHLQALLRRPLPIQALDEAMVERINQRIYQ
jgi:type VI secretion system protein ImpL